jgi:hypothetical protein
MLGCDLTWLVNMAAQILITCCPSQDNSGTVRSGSLDGGSSQGTADWYVTHAAMQLVITLEAQVTNQAQQAGQHELQKSASLISITHDDLLPRLAPVVGRIIASLGALELGSTLADWALGHYDVFAL